VPTINTTPNITNITNHSAFVTWDLIQSDSVYGYSMSLNGVEVHRGSKNFHYLVDLRNNTTYFVSVAAIADFGTDGNQSPVGNFTTLEV